jgi:Domain of unknown function (DUF4189)
MRSTATFNDGLAAMVTHSMHLYAAMRLPRWWHVTVLGALMLPGLVQAQSICPPGQYQATPPGIPGPVVCAPIAHDRDGHVLAPPPRANRWGAMASDRVASRVATSANLPNKQEAEKAALASCSQNGGSACSVAIAYGNGCGALAVGERGLSASADVTKEFARRAAMHLCISHGDQSCHVVHVACSDPSSDH